MSHSKGMTEYLAMLERVTDGRQLMEVGGSELHTLLSIVASVFERFNGAVQTLAHAIMLGELLAMMDEGVSTHEMKEGVLLTAEDRLDIIIAEIRTTLRLSRQLRASIPDTTTAKH
jgi:hypothetical protein